MSEWAGVGARPIHRAAIETTNLGRERIVFLASRQVVYQCLSQAAQKHFAVFEVSLVDQLSVADVPDSAVRLVLLGHGQGSINCVAECRRRYPVAAIGLVIDHAGQEFDRALVDQRLVQGILPLSLPLDVWLAVVSLLVAGGEYLSLEAATAHDDASARPRAGDLPEMLSDPAGEAEAAFGPRHLFDDPVSRQVRAGAVVPGIETLTARERQILQLVSEGYQNKLIADRMALSEHTVKAHVHNLIAKLRVTNRTQAAAAFLHEHEIAQAQRADVGVDTRLVALHGR